MLHVVLPLHTRARVSVPRFGRLKARLVVDGSAEVLLDESDESFLTTWVGSGRHTFVLEG